MNSKELTELILHNTRIILPEFGAFLVKDNGEKEFNPKNVSFSPFLRYNDGMLEVYIAKSRGISKEEAAKDIHDFVETIKNELLENGVYQLEGLGLLKRDQRGSLSFVLSLPNDKTPQSDISSSEKLISKKILPIDTISPVENSDEIKDDWPEIDMPKEETKISPKKPRKASEPKAKVEKLTVTNKLIIPSNIDNQPIQEPTNEIVNEPVVKGESERESIPSPEPVVISIPKPTPETKPIEKVVEVKEEKKKDTETELTSHPIEPRTKEPKKRKGFAGFVYTVIAIIIIVGLVLIVKYYYLPPNVESINESLSIAETHENKIDNKVEANDKIDKPKDDIDKAYNEVGSENKVKPAKTKDQLKKEEAQEEAIKKNIIKNAQNSSNVKTKYYVVAGKL